ncbi:putative Arf GTPase activating protein [Helianthus annuus]|nr:putative Arf GTPase activating protein [Helianthus annuus]
MMSRFKEEERNEKAIRNLLKLPENRRCINCNSLGPQYVCTNFWTFVCTTCSGIHREFTHRVKSVSMAKFTSQEVSALQGGGNASAKEIYFKEWDPQRQSFPDSSNVERLRDFIKHVYVDRRYSGERSFDKPPRVKTGEAEGSRSLPFRDGRNSEDGKLSNGGFKVDEKSPDHQRDPDISSPPVIRPVRDILGDKASPVRIEAPKSNGSLRTQRTVSSSSLGSSNEITTEHKTESSLIDFDAVPEPSSTAQAPPQVQQAAPSVSQPTTSSNNNWANFDSFQEAKPVHTPSTTNLLDALSELSVPAFSANPPAGPSGNTQLPVSTPTSYPTNAPGPNAFGQGQHVHPQQNQAFAPSFNQAIGGSHNNQQWNPSLSGHSNTQVLSSSQGVQTQVTHGVDVKPTAKKELPADLFSSNFSSFAAPGPGWFPAPQYGMGFNMQYNVPMPMPPVYQQPSKPSNPFDVNDSSPVQATTFPSMVPLQGALPNMVPQASIIHRTTSLGTLSPSWMPTQSSNPLPSTSTLQRTTSLGAPPSPWMPTQSSHPLSYGPPMPSGPFMGQVGPNMPPSYRPQAAGSFGSFNSSQQQSGSGGGNPFG